jgi:glucose-1-phosphate adenylyltransferase
MKDAVALVLAGGRVEELSVLTQIRAKAAVPFGGKYRIIDFALSSCMRSGFERVGVISLYRPSSLIDHVGIGEPWDLVGRGRRVKILPPYLNEEGSGLYRGTADAVWQNRGFFQPYPAREVLVLSGDHICGFDFRPMVEQHRRTGADLTIMVKRMDPSLGKGRFGVAEVDGQGRVIGYQEKAKKPRSDLVSLTIYLFRKEVLLERLEENQRNGQTFHIPEEIIPEMVRRDRVFAFQVDGYWNYTRSIESFLQANLDLLQDPSPIDLRGWSIRTRQRLHGLGDMPPALLLCGASVRRSIVSGGCRVDGTVENSVLFQGVQVERGAQIVNSVVFDDCRVGAGARLEWTILDKQVQVGQGAALAGRPEACVVVGKGARIEAGARLEAGAVVQPQLGAVQPL